MRVALAFGKSGLNLELPQGPSWQILQTRSETPIQDVPDALAAALDHPIDSPGLMELARGKSTVAIAVCDITRPVPNAVTLSSILDRLHRAGIARDGISILIATGLHRPATAAELETILGPSIAKSYRVFNHNAKDLASHIALGETQRGTPVYIDRNFVSADLHITLGLIEQHLMAGFSGGRKLIAPGLAAQETIKVLHSPKFMREPNAAEGSIDNNPLHAELLEIAAIARHDFMLDVALTKDRQITGIFAGHGSKAHAAGVRFLRDSMLLALPEPVDAAITTAAGYPLDLTFYQMIKGVTAAQHIVKPGGKILVCGECTEGVGSSQFAAKLARLSTYESFLNEIQNTLVEVDQWQLEKLAMAGCKHEILFYAPGISPQAVGGMSGQVLQTPTAAMSALLEGLPQNARIAVIPEGPYVFAQLKECA